MVIELFIHRQANSSVLCGRIAGDQGTEASESLTIAIVSLRKKSALLELFLSFKKKRDGIPAGIAGMISLIY